jgi:hypothetical protein
LELNVNAALVEATAPLGPVRIVVSGAIESTVIVRVAGVGSGAPVTLSARTANVCEPCESVGAVNGEVQAANAALSMRHSKPAAPPAPVKFQVGVVSAIVPLGPPVIVVSSCSTVNARDAGVGSAKTPSNARTENV